MTVEGRKRTMFASRDTSIVFEFSVVLHPENTDRTIKGVLECERDRDLLSATFRPTA